MIATSLAGRCVCGSLTGWFLRSSKRPGRRWLWFGADAADAADVADAFEFILGGNGWMLDGLDDAGRAVALDALRATTDVHRTADGVTFASATWTTTARLR